ncbi:MAG: heavy metal-associated domain-containing protein [Saprospiraceae bacterium]
MNFEINIQNLKCGGCAARITKNLSAIQGIREVFVNTDTDSVSFQTENESILPQVELSLTKMGYPKVEDANSLLLKAKSFVSCAIGRIDNMVESTEKN